METAPPLRKSALPPLFRAMGLPVSAENAERREAEKPKEKPERKAVPKTPPQPLEPRWRFLTVPEEAITHRVRGGARIALPEEEGFAVWVPRFRLKRLGDGIVLAARADVRYRAEKRERDGKKWKTAESRTLDRADLAKLFPPADAGWDDLGEYDEPDNPKRDAHAWVKRREPEPLGMEEREIRNELLMGSEEASWQEADA